ncbi:MAG: hypothetical protein J6W81_07685, partial [Lentisphaeria bacterium]|nr:hypothetical protein [Lentisphaeria bacterium]
VDQRAPELKVLGIPTTWLNGTATVSVQATDYGSGIKTVEYSYDNKNWSAGTSVKMGYNGTVYFRATDNVGLTTSISATVNKIDMVAPTLTLSQNQVNNALVKVSATASDWGSGVKNIEYSYDNNKWFVGSSVDMTYNGIIYFRATDNAGVVTKQSARISSIQSASSNLDFASGATADSDLLAGWEKGTDSSDLSGFSDSVNGNLTDDLCAYNDTITLFGNAAQDSLTDNLAASLDADSVLAEDKNKGMIA